jgi:hypothetical protein
MVALNSSFVRFGIAEIQTETLLNIRLNDSAPDRSSCGKTRPVKNARCQLAKGSAPE